MTKADLQKELEKLQRKHNAALCLINKIGDYSIARGKIQRYRNTFERFCREVDHA